MQSKDLENHIEFLLSAALQKCGNIYDAEDLTQETHLAALTYMARGKEIQDVKAWLLVVMGRKFNDMLGGKVYVGFALAEQLDRITVFIFAQLMNTVTFRAKAKMIGNHHAFSVIKCFVSGKERFCLQLFEK